MSVSPRVAVVLLIHADYAERYLAACYASLMAQTYPAEAFTVFIVNNGVSVESRRVAGRVAPQARFIDHADNLGWTGGTNSALRLVVADGYEAVALLNVDAVAHPRWLEELVAAMQAHPEAHIFQAQILLAGTETVNSLGTRVHYLGYGTCAGYGRPQLRNEAVRLTQSASGASMVVRRNVCEAIGLFREDYFIYHEDVEFCWRARLAGFQIALVPQAVCWHHYRLHKSPASFFLLQRNRLLTLLTLQRLRTLLLLAPCLLASEGMMALYLLGCGQGRWVARLVGYFLQRSTWRLIAQRRREVRRLRTCLDADIMRHVTGTIIFADTHHPLLRYLFNPFLGLYWSLIRPLIVW
jgi:GT2 family glycosyltransferase